MILEYFSVFVTYKDICLYNHNTTIKIRKLNDILLLSSYSIQVSPFVPERSEFRIVHLIYLICFNVFINLEKFLNMPFTFMTLTLVKIAGQLFCKMSLNLGLSYASSLLDSDNAYLLEISWKWWLAFSLPPIRKHVIWFVTLFMMFTLVT